MQLKYNVTTRDGRVYGVYDQRNDGRRTTHYFGPFESEEDAKEQCRLFEESYGFGYSGSAYPVLKDGRWYSYQDRWNSCD